MQSNRSCSLRCKTAMKNFTKSCAWNIPVSTFKSVNCCCLLLLLLLIIIIIIRRRRMISIFVKCHKFVFAGQPLKMPLLSVPSSGQGHKSKVK